MNNLTNAVNPPPTLGYARSRISGTVFFCSTCEYCGKNFASTNRAIIERLEWNHRNHCTADTEIH